MPKRMGRIAYGACFFACVAPAMIFKVIGLGPLNLAALALGVGAVYVTALRLHDIDKSGWWSLLVLVPFGHILVILGLLAWPGTKGDNQFGPIPRL